jgi:metallopeptidase MepB
MSTEYPKPPPAPEFTHTPESIVERTKQLINLSRNHQDGIAKSITPEKATFQNVLKPLVEDDNEMALETAILGFYQYVSTDKALRDASSEAEKLQDVSGPPLFLRAWHPSFAKK